MKVGAPAANKEPPDDGIPEKMEGAPAPNNEVYPPKIEPPATGLGMAAMLKPLNGFACSPGEGFVPNMLCYAVALETYSGLASFEAFFPNILADPLNKLPPLGIVWPNRELLG